MPTHDGEAGGEGTVTLSRAEVIVAFQNLTDGEKTALAKIARLYAAKTPYDHADLLQEAMCRVLGGERQWPRGVPALLFLGGVVRSLAWQWRRREQRSGETDPAGDAISGPPQEWALFLGEFVGSFDDDPVARAVLLAVMEGRKGQELLAVIAPMLSTNAGSGQASRADVERELERVLKKIRRRVEKHRREVGPI